jgi:hypothetical protein
MKQNKAVAAQLWLVRQKGLAHAQNPSMFRARLHRGSDALIHVSYCQIPKENQGISPQ